MGKRDLLGNLAGTKLTIVEVEDVLLAGPKPEYALEVAIPAGKSSDIYYALMFKKGTKRIKGQ